MAASAPPSRLMENGKVNRCAVSVPMSAPLLKSWASDSPASQRLEKSIFAETALPATTSLGAVMTALLPSNCPVFLFLKSLTHSERATGLRDSLRSRRGNEAELLAESTLKTGL